MNIALKEWSSVIAALDQSHQIFLLRKGGIVEQKRGFEVRHKSFLLYPSFEHQHALSLKAEFRHLAQPPPGPGILIWPRSLTYASRRMCAIASWKIRPTSGTNR